MAHTDQKYIEALLQNDEPLIREIYQKWGPEVRNFVLKNNGTVEDAKDIFQESMAALLLKIRKEKFTLTVPLGGYLYFIYRSKWFNKLAKNKKEPVMIKELSGYKYSSDDFQWADETNLLHLRSTIFKACFEQLKEVCQKILSAKYEEGLKGIQVMEKYNIPTLGAVGKRMFDCREQLRRIIIKHPQFDELHLKRGKWK